jgi:hypothetical protein
VTAEDLVLVKYAHKLSDVKNEDSWISEFVRYKEIDKLLDLGYIVSVEWEHQVMNTEDN